jgi:hypothetical protein
MVKTKVDAGICGFATNITAECDDMQMVSFNIESGCPNIQGLALDIPEIDAYQELGDGLDGVIFTKTAEHTKPCCPGCIVPSAIFKSMQVAAGLALPASSTIEIEKI